MDSSKGVICDKVQRQADVVGTKGRTNESIEHGEEGSEVRLMGVAEL